MPGRRIVIDKSAFELKVIEDSTVLGTYLVAIGEREDGGPRIYEEDFRTPEGSFRINQIWKVGDFGLKLPNMRYYPCYLAHKYGNPLEDLGKGAYGDGLIILDYPRPEDKTRYQELLESGEIESDWHQFMEEKWRAVFEHAARTQGVDFHEVKLHYDGWEMKRNFMEDMTFDELYHSVPPEPETGMPSTARTTLSA